MRKRLFNQTPEQYYQPSPSSHRLLPLDVDGDMAPWGNYADKKDLFDYNYIFPAVLTIKDFDGGRIKYRAIVLEDAQGNNRYMLIKNFLEAAKSGRIEPGGIIRGDFKFTMKYGYFGVVLV
jgi:hypothetical protein